MDNKEIVVLAGKNSTAGGSVSSVNGKTGAVVLTAADLDDSFKDALLDCFANVAWATEDGQQYYDALEAALYPLDHITAVYTQSGTVYDTDSLDSLKSDLVVTATYADNTVRTVTYYTLSGMLTVGTSTITVNYGGKTTTFTVTVTASSGTSDMDGWTDGVAYTDLEVVQNEYVKATDGSIQSYNGWNRTGYVPCDGASSLTVPPMPQEETARVLSNWFYDENHNPVNGFQLSRTESTTVTVPATAKYFIVSSNAAALASCIGAGIVPHAPINE